MTLPTVYVRKKGWRVTEVRIDDYVIPKSTEINVHYPRAGMDPDVMRVTIDLLVAGVKEEEETD